MQSEHNVLMCRQILLHFTATNIDHFQTIGSAALYPSKADHPKKLQSVKVIRQSNYFSIKGFAPPLQRAYSTGGV